MKEPDPLLSAMAGLRGWKRAALELTCAESLFSIITAFASTGTKAVFTHTLHAAWSAVQHSDNVAVIPFLKKKLLQLPESSCDDSHNPAYNAMCAIAVLDYSLDALIAAGESSLRVSSCGEAANILSGYDFVLKYGTKAITVDPEHPEPTGPLETRHLEMQKDVIARLQMASAPSDELIAALRAVATRLSSEIEPSLTEYSAIRGW